MPLGQRWQQAPGLHEDSTGSRARERSLQRPATGEEVMGTK